MANIGETLAIEAEIAKVLKDIYDPEMPASIYDLGLIYDVCVDADGLARITMTLTAPNCPMADELVQEVQERVGAVEGVTEALVDLVFDPPWDTSRIDEGVKLELGLL